jgi:xanthosine utilization system XapX-like protein
MKRHAVALAFGLVAVIAILALFVVDGPAGGILALVAMIGFILACMAALRARDAGSDADRTGVAGWFGGWF